MSKKQKIHAGDGLVPPMKPLEVNAAGGQKAREDLYNLAVAMYHRLKLIRENVGGELGGKHQVFKMDCECGECLINATIETLDRNFIRPMGSDA